MKVRKLFKDSGMPYEHVIQLCDGSFAKFFITPFRKISKSDLMKLPYYTARGIKGEEAEEYIYKLYGLEKSN